VHTLLLYPVHSKYSTVQYSTVQHSLPLLSFLGSRRGSPLLAATGGLLYSTTVQKSLLTGYHGLVQTSAVVPALQGTPRTAPRNAPAAPPGPEEDPLTVCLRPPNPRPGPERGTGEGGGRGRARRAPATAGPSPQGREERRPVLLQRQRWKWRPQRL